MSKLDQVNFIWMTPDIHKLFGVVSIDSWWLKRTIKFKFPLKIWWSNIFISSVQFLCALGSSKIWAKQGTGVAPFTVFSIGASLRKQLVLQYSRHLFCSPDKVDAHHRCWEFSKIQDQPAMFTCSPTIQVWNLFGTVSIKLFTLHWRKKQLIW